MSRELRSPLVIASHDITVCLTMGLRPELLSKTIESLGEDLRALPIVAINDFGDKSSNAVFNELCPNGRLIDAGQRVGHMRAIDILYQSVQTKYILHIEDDWEFERDDFIASAVQILDENDTITSVCLRSISDMKMKAEKQDKVIKNEVAGVDVLRLDGTDEKFFGYTFNPHVARRSLWTEIGGFSQFRGEGKVSQHFRDRGQYCVFLQPGACRHIGWGSSARQGTAQSTEVLSETRKSHQEPSQDEAIALAQQYRLPSPRQGSAILCDIRNRDDFFVGLGHPRCGTGFTANLLAANGLDIGHEVVQQNGIISWMLPAERYRNPFNDALGPLPEFQNIFCVARSPITAIPSIIPENSAKFSVRFRRQVIRDRFGTDHLGRRKSKNDIEAAIVSYVCWYELCLSFGPKVIFRVEHEEDDKRLANLIGQPISRKDDIARNSRPRRRQKDFSKEQLRSVSTEWLFRLADLCVRLGYQKEADEVFKYVSR